MVARNRLVILFTALVLILGGIGSNVLFGKSFLSILSVGLGIAALAYASSSHRRLQTQPSLSLSQQKSQSDKLKELRKYISKTQYLENVGSYGEKAADQLTQIFERYDLFRDLLLSKFNPNEITYERYYSTAEQTFLSVVDQLYDIASTLNSINSIDLKQVESRILHLSSHSENNPQDHSEITSLTERKALYDRQINRIHELLTLNEKAITEFDRVTTALSETQTKKGESNTQLDIAIAQLNELANRAKHYNRS